MDCPHCKKTIDDKMIAKYLAAKGGSKGKRLISPEAQAKMQAGRKLKKDKS